MPGGGLQREHEKYLREREEVADREPGGRMMKVRRLAKTGKGQELIPYLSDPERGIRRYAAKSLGALAFAPAEDALIEALSDDEIGHVAAKSLGKIRSTRAVEPMLELLGHGMPGVADFQLIEALGDIGDDRACPALIAALDAKGTWYDATEALGKIGTDEAHDAIVGHPPPPSRWYARLTWKEARDGRERRLARDQDRLVRPAIRMIAETITNLMSNLVTLGLVLLVAALSSPPLLWTCGGVAVLTAGALFALRKKSGFRLRTDAIRPLPREASALGVRQSALSRVKPSWAWALLPEILILGLTYVCGVAIVGIWVIGALYAIGLIVMGRRLFSAITWQRAHGEILLTDRDETYGEGQCFSVPR